MSDPSSRHTIATLVAQQDALRRELHSAQADASRLKSLLDQQTGRADKSQADLIAARKTAASAEQAQHKQQRELALAHQQRAEADAALAANADYVRKLEGKLVNGKQGQFLLEQNSRLRAAVLALQGERDEARTRADGAAGELERATREIEVLATALEMRADELALGGDLRSGLLYEVAHRREEVRRLREDGAATEAREKQAAAEAADARAQLARSQEDVSTLAERAASLSAELTAEQTARAQLQEVSVG